MLRKLARALLPKKILRILYAHGLGDGLIGMTSVEEQAYYKQAVVEVRNQIGAIVDLGCWMCSTSLSLAQGLRTCDSGKWGDASKIIAFDRFIWESWMDGFLPKVSRDYRAGENFLDEAQRRIQQFADCIELIQADLTEYQWDKGPIKLLLVDTMKTWELAESVTKSFYPHLQKDSLLIHQDYKHFYIPWIHILQYRLRDYFKIVHEVNVGGTVAFRTLRPVPQSIAEAAVDFKKISDEEVNAAAQYSMQSVREQGKSSVAAAHVMYFIHQDRHADANTLFNRYLKDGLLRNADMKGVQQLIMTSA